MNDIAQACWEAIDEIAPGESAILVGCSVGSAIITYMHNLSRRGRRALILSGTGYQPGKGVRPPSHRRLQEVRHRFSLALHLRRSEPGVPRHAARNILCRHVRRAQPVRRHQSIIHQFEAHAAPNPEDHEARIACPAIILTGSEDNTHKHAFPLQERIKSCELKVLPGAGHACQIEQPWLFNRLHDRVPEKARPVSSPSLIERRKATNVRCRNPSPRKGIPP